MAIYHVEWTGKLSTLNSTIDSHLQRELLEMLVSKVKPEEWYTLKISKNMKGDFVSNTCQIRYTIQLEDVQITKQLLMNNKVNLKAPSSLWQRLKHCAAYLKSFSKEP